MDCAPSKASLWVASLLLAMGLLSAVQGQSIQAPTQPDDLQQEKLRLLADVQGLVARAKQLEKPLARGMAEAEIADAAWSLDRELAKELLRDALNSAFPDEAEQAKLRQRPIGGHMEMPTPAENARSTLQALVMRIASRDKVFARELAGSVAEKLGHYAAHMSYASLAGNAIEDGDIEAAGKYINQALDADPTLLNGSGQINQLASKNRSAADDLILAYINQLNSLPLSYRDEGQMRINMALSILMRPSEFSFFGAAAGTPPPGPAVMRAYVGYILNSVTLKEQQFPGSITSSRLQLLYTYPLLTQYAPELKPQFLALEQRSRKPGESLSLPTAKSIDEECKAKRHLQEERELDSDHPDGIIIQRVISRGDFAKARKMIEKLADGPRKSELLEMLNAQEVVSLTNKGDISGAQKLAESLVKAGSILRVFPLIAGKCAEKNDDACARDSVNQAVRQLKRADMSPFTPPPGIPVSVMGTSRDFDFVLKSLGSLASAVISLKDELALDVLDEMVIAANHSELDTGQGRTGFETSLFKKMAEKNEERTVAAAIQFQDSLRQIIALAAIDQWKVDKLVKAEALIRKANPSTRKQ
jgi:tetratricopeptide (TPR) repeat protein